MSEDLSWCNREVCEKTLFELDYCLALNESDALDEIRMLEAIESAADALRATLEREERLQNGSLTSK